MVSIFLLLLVLEVMRNETFLDKNNIKNYHLFEFLFLFAKKLMLATFSSHDSFLQITVTILSFRTNRSEQTVQTQLLEEQSDQGLHCLVFHLHLFDEIS